MANKRIAVIMAGGSGERFWPASRKARPKQLLKLASETESMIEQTISRIRPLVDLENIYVATVPHLKPLCEAHLPQLAPENIVAEPHKRNTMGCLVWFFATLLSKFPDAAETTTLTVLSADHLIEPQADFLATVEACFEAVESNGGVLNVGIPPTRPETGYGYLQIDSAATPMGTEKVKVWPLKLTVEKPDRPTAEAYVASGDFLWSSGIFFYTVKGFLNEMQMASPEHYAATFELAELLRAGNVEGAAARFEALPNISYDYAMGEKAQNAWTATAPFQWDDVGAWDALERSFPSDADGNVARGSSLAVVSTKNSIIVNETNLAVGVMGMEGVVVVVTEDAILVCPKDQAQKVRSVVEKFASDGIPVT